jgi:hypothetical protein
MGKLIHRLIEQGSAPSLTQIASRAPRNDGARKVEHHSHFEMSPRGRPRVGIRGRPQETILRRDPDGQKAYRR